MLHAESISKEYPSPAGPLRVLNQVSATWHPGQIISIMGPSGSGKSTLLSILGALDPPTSGRFTLDGQDPYALPEAELAAFRNRQVGFVFQDHCLLPQCTVIENVLIPTLAAGAENHETRARELLDRVGLGGRVDHLPSQLSGGEKQRAALARSLILGPRLLLCDEPTGNLDRKSAESVASLLVNLQDRERMIVVIVTHSEKLAAVAPIQYELDDGRLSPR